MMESKKGILRITKYVKNILSDRNKPYNFDIDINKSFNNKECFFELNNNGEVIKIIIEKEIFELKKSCKNNYKFKIPKDTCIAMENQSVDNFHLKLNRFAKFNKDGYKLQHQNINEKFFYTKWIFYKTQIDKYYENIRRLNLIFSNLIELEIDYRLLIGSEVSVYETSIRLHYIYGIPFIPSTAIKGVVRSYYILENFADELKEYENRYNIFEDEVLFKNKTFVNYFGSQEKEGKIIFFDAFPTSKPNIKIDIMNPHYGDYYNKDKAPTDDKNPIPINFLTIEDTTFQFLIASRETIDNDFIELFKEALQNHGIGAKTAVGYGYFTAF